MVCLYGGKVLCFCWCCVCGLVVLGYVVVCLVVLYLWIGCTAVRYCVLSCVACFNLLHRVKVLCFCGVVCVD